jgi:hypothetical protein
MCRVTGDKEKFKSIEERLRDRIKRIGCGQKKYPREIKVNVKVVIAELYVLVRIQNFKECRGGITSKVGSYLIELIKDEDWIITTSLLQTLNDATRKSTYVGSPVTADLCFIANST